MNTSEVVPLNSLSSRPWRVVALESSVILLINIIGVLGNLCLCVAVHRCLTTRGTCTYILIVTLSIADLVVSLVAMPLTVAVLIYGKWFFTNIGCQIQGFLVHLLAFISLQVMSLTAYSRYLRVIKPSRFRTIFTKRRTIAMVLLSCILSTVFLAVLIFSRSSSFVFHPNKALCVLKFRSIFDSKLFTMVTGLVYVIAPATVITVCYSKVFLAIRKHNRTMNDTDGGRPSFDTGSTVQSVVRVSPPATVRNLRADRPPVKAFAIAVEAAHRHTRGATKLSVVEIKITKIIFAIIMAFAICWIPCFAIDLIDTQIDGWLDRRVYLTYTLLAYLSSAVNPLIYGGMFSILKNKCSNWLRSFRRQSTLNK